MRFAGFGGFVGCFRHWARGGFVVPLHRNMQKEWRDKGKQKRR